MKSRSSEARRIAQALAVNYEASIPIDTIVCMDGLEVIGAYLAEELSKAGVLSMNMHQTIYITSPDYNSYKLHDCPLCKARQKVDAIVSGNGYSKL